jgi:hypothetical protein
MQEKETMKLAIQKHTNGVSATWHDHTSKTHMDVEQLGNGEFDITVAFNCSTMAADEYEVTYRGKQRSAIDALHQLADFCSAPPQV